MIDWEQRRYEIARDILTVKIAQPHSMCDDLIQESIDYADRLIERLKKE